MFIADAHCDTLCSIALDGKKIENCTVNPQTMRDGGVCLQTFAMFAGRKGTKGTPYEDGRRMLAASYQLPVEILRGRLPEQPPVNFTSWTQPSSTSISIRWEHTPRGLYSSLIICWLLSVFVLNYNTMGRAFFQGGCYLPLPVHTLIYKQEKGTGRGWG